MLGEASVSFVGNVSQAPELRVTQSGQAVCNFTVAVSGRRKSQAGGYEDGPTSFYRVTAWRDLGEHVANSLGKGDRVLVLGDLSVREFEQPDGSRGRSVEVEAQEVGPSLRFADAVVKRAARNTGAAPALAGAASA